MDDASQPIPQHIIEAALCKAFADAPIKPMSVAELAPIYGLNRRKMRLVLKSMGRRLNGSGISG